MRTITLEQLTMRAVADAGKLRLDVLKVEQELKAMLPVFAARASYMYPTVIHDHFNSLVDAAGSLHEAIRTVDYIAMPNDVEVAIMQMEPALTDKQKFMAQWGLVTALLADCKQIDLVDGDMMSIPPNNSPYIPARSVIEANLVTSKAIALNAQIFFDSNDKSKKLIIRPNVTSGVTYNPNHIIKPLLVETDLSLDIPCSLIECLKNEDPNIKSFNQLLRHGKTINNVEQITFLVNLLIAHSNREQLPIETRRPIEKLLWQIDMVSAGAELIGRSSVAKDGFELVNCIDKLLNDYVNFDSDSHFYRIMDIAICDRAFQYSQKNEIEHLHFLDHVDSVMSEHITNKKLISTESLINECRDRIDEFKKSLELSSNIDSILANSAVAQVAGFECNNEQNHTINNAL